ncbi:MAG: hypothetical protein JXQ93_02635 [Flavobacteriaceae bacterium]
MLTENKFSKYLIYAIGEIILVVIGILIALQINNLNEQRKDREVEILILQNIILDLDSDISELEFIKNHTSNHADSLNANYNALLDGSILKNSNRLYEFFGQLWATSNIDWFEVNSSVYDENLSSGKFTLVQNDSLRQKISEYYRFTKISHRDNDARTYALREIRPMIYDVWGTKKEFLMRFNIKSNFPSFNPIEFSKDERLGKIILIYNTHSFIQIEKWDQYKYRASRLKDNITEELKFLLK